MIGTAIWDSVKCVVCLPMYILLYLMISALGGYLIKAGILAREDGQTYGSHFTTTSFWIPEEVMMFGSGATAALLALLIIMVIIVKTCRHLCKAGANISDLDTAYVIISESEMRELYSKQV
jgi:hypothetical protein